MSELYVPPKPKRGRKRSASATNPTVKPAAKTNTEPSPKFDSDGNPWLLPDGLIVDGSKERLDSHACKRVALRMKEFKRQLFSGDLYVRTVLGGTSVDLDDVDEDDDVLL
ncbi:MAG: hypothetical protein WBD37_11460 [Anderseniella sp.]